jgi:hypothetical protein
MAKHGSVDPVIDACSSSSRGKQQGSENIIMHTCLLWQEYAVAQ